MCSAIKKSLKVSRANIYVKIWGGGNAPLLTPGSNGPVLTYYIVCRYILECVESFL